MGFDTSPATEIAIHAGIEVTGKGFNAWSAALLVRMLAEQTGLEPRELVRVGGDVHLYLNHAALVEDSSPGRLRAIRGSRSCASRIRSSTIGSRIST